MTCRPQLVKRLWIGRGRRIVSDLVLIFTYVIILIYIWKHYIYISNDKKRLLFFFLSKFEKRFFGPHLGSNDVKNHFRDYANIPTYNFIIKKKKSFFKALTAKFSQSFSIFPPNRVSLKLEHIYRSRVIPSQTDKFSAKSSSLNWTLSWNFYTEDCDAIIRIPTYMWYVYSFRNMIFSRYLFFIQDTKHMYRERN